MVEQNGFDYTLIEETAHRPWPLPEKPWIMTQSWHDLLFAHWPVDKAELRDKVPRGFALDDYDGQAWVGIVAFHMTNVAPRGVPALPWISAFPELNVRTYVTVDRRPGVYFFSLDAGNPVAVGAARTLFHLPYFSAAIDVEVKDGWVQYSSRRRNSKDGTADFVARYRGIGPIRTPQPGSLEYFLTERYCLYTVDDSFRPYRLEIHHRPWPLQAAELEVTSNTMATAIGIRLAAAAPLLHFAKRQDMVGWALERI